MWIKDIRNYDVEIYEDGKIIYSGNINDVSDDLKEKETKNVKIEQKIIIIEI